VLYREHKSCSKWIREEEYLGGGTRHLEGLTRGSSYSEGFTSGHSHL
jgi:hypothetical protein